MRLKAETDYAIRMVDYLAKSGEITGAAEISEEAKVPLRFAKNILQKLAKKKIIISHKGVKGGYELGKKIDEISLYDVVEATDGSIKIIHCQLKGNDCPCTSDKGCPYHEALTQISMEMESRLREVKFGKNYYAM